MILNLCLTRQPNPYFYNMDVGPEKKVKINWSSSSFPFIMFKIGLKTSTHTYIQCFKTRPDGLPGTRPTRVCSRAGSKQKTG